MCMAWVELDSALEADDGLVKLAQLAVGNTEVVKDGRICGS